MNKTSITFTPPNSNRVISWKETLTPSDPDSENLVLLGIDIVNGVPYLVLSPVGVLSNNKWGCRDDPRYVALKFDGETWKQIQMKELPAEIKNANLVITAQGKGLNSHSGVLTVKEVTALNFNCCDPDTLKFERKPPDQPQPPCVKLINYKGRWIRPDDDRARKMIDSVTK